MIEYNGVKIEVSTTTGKFTAVAPDGTVLVKTSLQAVQRALDKMQAFKPFTAYIRTGWWGKKNALEKVTVIGIKAPGQRRFDRTAEWRVQLKNGTTTSYMVYAGTPENLAALNALEAVMVRQEKEERAMTERHQKEKEAAEAKVVELRPPAPEKGKR